jgi:hypothetical protein
MSDSILIGFIDSLDNFFCFSLQQTMRDLHLWHQFHLGFFELSSILMRRVDVLTMIPVIETTIKQFLTRAFGIDFWFSFLSPDHCWSFIDCWAEEDDEECWKSEWNRMNLQQTPSLTLTPVSSLQPSMFSNHT